MDKKLALIGGTSLLKSELFTDWQPHTIETDFGEVNALQNSGFVFIQRHGKKLRTPPHRINYHANIAAVHECGIKQIIAINSTGSLRPDLPPGTLVIPDDYFNLFNIPTYHDVEMKFVIPGLDPDLRQYLLDLAGRHGITVIPQGVYFQVQGPILETPAEIRFARQIGDILGMTMAKEAILAKELDLGYASICMVDNYANGIVDTPLTMDEIHTRQQANLVRLERYIGGMLEDFK